MSSLAGPSSYSSFSVRPQQPPAISTKLRRVVDVESTPPSAVTSATAPPTPIARAQSIAETEGRGESLDRQVNGHTQRADDRNGNGERNEERRRPQDVKASISPDLDAVRARVTTWSRKQGRTIEEETAMVQTALRIASRLAEDQRAALAPDTDTPFADQVDVVTRLLPYHVFQHPREDLDAVLQSGSIHPSRKGKRKATEEDLLRAEIADTKFALDCWKRRRALEKRFRKARIEEGKRASPADQGYVLAQAVLEVERADTTALQQELRSARQELDKLEREKRLTAPPPPVPTPAAAASRPTMSVRTANYYNPSATSTPSQTPTTATFMPPYRPYSYSYSQYPTTQYTYNPHAYGATHYGSAASYGAATSTPTTPAYSPPASATTMTQTSAASAQVQQAQAHPASASNTAVPVQLPVTSLNALSALGIVPIAAASVPSAGPQPPAVIKSTNGSTLNLEINLSLLQSAQMSGLALILNALTSRGVNVDGSTAASGISATPSQPASYANGGGGTAAPAGTATSAAAAGSTASASNAASCASGIPSSVPPAAVQSTTPNAVSPPSAAASGPASSASTSPSSSASAGTPQT
ncbi:uncharacterized protein TRAVEDRAFT_69420 [Trametes versicolor FP-101664 SS1]|uniref:uncharacterized protein n=1 Tax=Trametes versicolor (strain FP-101664) TaxID=717944 RepID=UPI000462409D|nr:uncharacterized protein TRAVEDRAFT_69420 [Trametes versicolor FP-101664 SS1]EIW63403.1 hypothetical protein TRAVEDRAFT_69420 [Trametes versicolor FP-101664 SS1]